MKIIGDIRPEFGENNELLNKDYVEGSIVQLTYSELSALVKLYTVINEQEWNNSFLRMAAGGMERHLINNVDFAEVFDIIMRYVTQKFHLNNLRDNLNEMEQLLYDLEQKEEGFS